ncbi:hypothetical protein [Escherichia coli]
MRKIDLYYAAQQVKSELTCAEAVDEREQDRHLSFSTEYILLIAWETRL